MLNLKLFSLFTVSFLALSAFSRAFANVPPQSALTTSTSTTTTSAHPDSKILGSAELRPSYKSNQGLFNSENSVLLGYQFNRTQSLVYKQEFNSNLYDPNLSEAKSGLNGYLYSGYLRGRINDIWVNGVVSLSYEGRAYLPTWSVQREAGMQTALRNYLKLKYKAAPGLVFQFDEVPVFHFYDRAGSKTSLGNSANPVFENRNCLSAEYAFNDKLKIFVPLLFTAGRYRDYLKGAKYNNQWAYNVWIHPELTYAITPNFSTGVAYYSGNWVKPDLSSFNVNDAFKLGTAQLIVQTSL